MPPRVVRQPLVSPEMKLVACVGAIGGFASAIYTYMGGATYGVPLAAAALFCIPLGSIAAVITVFYVTPTDTSQRNRLIAYTLLCGFLWKPGIDAGKALVVQHLDAAAKQQSTTELQQSVASASPTTVATKVQAAGSSAASLLRTTHHIDNPDQQEKASQSAAAVVNEIAKKAPDNPTAATDALKEIGLAAKETNNQFVAELASKHLLQIARTAPVVPPVATRQRANDAFRALAAEHQ